MIARTVAVACLTAGFWISVLTAGLFALLTLVQYIRGDEFARPGVTISATVGAAIIAAACWFAREKFSSIGTDQ